MIAFDATVVRAPHSGVQYSVAAEAVALGTICSEFAVFARDPALLAACRDAGLAVRTGANSDSVLRRIVWQQTRLPMLAADASCLIAPSYTAPLRIRTPYLLQVHDTIALRRPELCAVRNVCHMSALMPRSIRQAHRVLVSATAEADHVQALFGIAHERIVRLPLGVDGAFLQAPAPEPTGRKPYVLFVSNLEPKKGLETLLRAFASLADDGLALRIAGRAAWRSGRIVREIQACPGDVEVLGYVEREALPALYANAAVTVVPSLEEGFGLPVLEAMACGCPVIHSDLPTLRETAGGHGIPFSCGDSTDLAKQIRAVLTSNPATEAARTWAHEHTWTRWATAVREIAQTVH